jgi:hypothetical protein
VTYRIIPGRCRALRNTCGTRRAHLLEQALPSKEPRAAAVTLALTDRSVGPPIG